MARERERYCARLISDALGGAKYEMGYRFPFLRGDATVKHPLGATLPVDAFYPDFNMVLEFMESQHYSERARLWDERMTATGETRRRHRKRYDDRRERVLPATGIRLVIVYELPLGGDDPADHTQSPLSFRSWRRCSPAIRS